MLPGNAMIGFSSLWLFCFHASFRFISDSLPSFLFFPFQASSRSATFRALLFGFPGENHDVPRRRSRFGGGFSFAYFLSSLSLPLRFFLFLLFSSSLFRLLAVRSRSAPFFSISLVRVTMFRAGEAGGFSFACFWDSLSFRFLTLLCSHLLFVLLSPAHSTPPVRIRAISVTTEEKRLLLWSLDTTKQCSFIILKSFIKN
jgi:hypothetical protein